MSLKNISLTDEEKSNFLKKIDNNLHYSTNIFYVIITFVIIYFTIMNFKNLIINNKNLRINQIYDSKGNGCGIGKLKEFKFLYFINFEYPYKSVCVKKCVKIDYNAVKYNLTNNDTIKPMYYKEFHKLLKKNKSEKNKAVNIINKIYEENWLFYFTEEQWEYYSKNYKVDCYLNEDVSSCNYSQNEDFIIYDSIIEYYPICIPLNKRIKKSIFKITNNINPNLFFSIIYNLKLIVYSGVISLLLGIYFLILIKYFSKFLIWTIIYLINSTFLAIGIYLQLTIYFQGFFIRLIERYNKYLSIIIINNTIIFFILSLLMILWGYIILVLIIRNKKKLKIWFNLTTKSSTILLKNFSNIIFNILFIFFKLILIYFTLIILYRIYCNKEILEKIEYQNGKPFIHYEFNNYKIFKFFEILFYFTFFYRLLDNIIIFNQISLFINYFNNKERNGIINLFYVIMKHIGTITLYSLLFIVNIIQLLLKLFTLDLIPYNNYFLNINQVSFGIVYNKGENYFKSVDIFVDLLNKFGNDYSLVFIFSKLIYYFIIIFITIISGKINVIILLFNGEITKNSFDLNFIYSISYWLSFIVSYSIMNNFYYSIMGLVICFLIDSKKFDISLNEETKIIFDQSKTISKQRKKYTKFF